MKGRRSSHVQLVALGTVLIGACADQDVPKDRYAYKARAECVQDWGDTNCEPSNRGAGVAAGALAGAYFLGPRFNSIVETPSGKYVWSGTAERPAIHPLTGQNLGSKAVNVSTPRGGFGSSAHSSSSGS